jgi:hypothetical protein
MTAGAAEVADNGTVAAAVVQGQGSPRSAGAAAGTAPMDDENISEIALPGGCQCGGVRYEIRGRPVDLYVCHCRECRKQSASAFGVSVIVRSADLFLVSGNPSVWTRPAAVGGSLACAFCPTCGSRVWHSDPDRDELISVKGGSLDEPPDLATARHIWTSRKLCGILIPVGAEMHDEEPPMA